MKDGLAPALENWFGYIGDLSIQATGELMKRRYRNLAERSFAKASLLRKVERVGTPTIEQASGQLPSHQGTRNALEKEGSQEPTIICQKRNGA